MSKAVVIGIDTYANDELLVGCSESAASLADLLESHGNEDPNFVVERYIGDKQSPVSSRSVKSDLIKLFRGRPKIALFYFAGKVLCSDQGLSILFSDSKEGPALPLNAVLELANESKATNKILIIDAHCTDATAANSLNKILALNEGVSILSSCRPDAFSSESCREGTFSGLLIDALMGGAADILGAISLASVYAHITQTLSAIKVSPTFIANVREFEPLRFVPPVISRKELRRLPYFFDAEKNYFPLNPSFEPTEKSATKENTEKFALLQKLNRINLVVPVGADHMYYAAINSKGCQLTKLGLHYLGLVGLKRV